MPPLIIPNCFQVTLLADRSGNEIVNVFSYIRPGGLASDECVTVGNNWRDNMMTPFLACVHTTYHAVSLTVKSLHAAGGPEAVIPLAGSYTGTRGSTSLPGGVAQVVSWYTSSSTRSGRGRTYFGPISELDTSGDTATAFLLAALATFGRGIVAYSPIIGARFGVASRHLHLVQTVTGFAIDALVDSQRRRLTGRGR